MNPEATLDQAGAALRDACDKLQEAIDAERRAVAADERATAANREATAKLKESCERLRTLAAVLAQRNQLLAACKAALPLVTAFAVRGQLVDAIASVEGVK